MEIAAPTNRAEIDRAISELAAGGGAWPAVPVEARIAYARGILLGTGRTAAALVETASRSKGVDPDSPISGEEWLSGPYTLARTVRILIRSLEGIRDRGTVPIAPSHVRELPGGGVAVEVVPTWPSDRVLYRGYRAEVRMQPGVTRTNLAGNVAGAYREPPPGRVSLVLGAGNVASIAPLDAIQKLFLEGSTVLLKLNPVNDYLLPILQEIFRDLIRDSFVRIVAGGSELGALLCSHDGIDEIHVTGSEATYDAIVFGGGEEGELRKRRNEPVQSRRITCELGNVSPVIVVPGRWSRGDLAFHAENVASQIVPNGGFYCNAARQIVTHDGWPQREEFLDALRGALRSAQARPSYYPGAEERYDRFLAAHPETEILGERTPGHLPPALIPGIDPEGRDEIAFTTESFCNIAGETALPASDASDFLDSAVEFCNGRLHGTLNACMLVDPRTHRRLGGRFDDAVAALRYGSVGINHWPALCFCLGATTWGAFPGHTPDDIQSGIGTVHNALMFDRPEKSVVEGPFRAWPKPPWFVSHRKAHLVGRRLVAFEAAPSLPRLAGIVAAAIGG